MPWDLYAAASKFLIYEKEIKELDERAWKNYLSIEIRNETRNYLKGTPTEATDGERIVHLTSALTQVRHLQATNPKDKIYGHLQSFPHSAFRCLLQITKSQWERYTKKLVLLSFSIPDLYRC